MLDYLEEAIAYKQVLEDVAIDRLHVVTIGTDGYEERVQEMAGAIRTIFNAGKHKVQNINPGVQTVRYKLPQGSYWKEWGNTDEHSSDFFVDISSISSVQSEDGEWAAVISDDNLKLAWARARRHLLDESLADEVEVRLFEAHLDKNIGKMQQQLIAYASEVVPTDGRIYYRFPKSSDKTRPRGLSKMEEEILSTALIQKLGAKVSSRMADSFAYKLAQVRGANDSEFLYEYWFKQYGLFINRACAAAREVNSGAVIRLDIKAFFTRIIRDQLKDIAIDELTKSKRIEWLLRLLFATDIDGHEAGLGIVQGNLSSGFFANLYLLDLDSVFPLNNQWEARFFRYVDDMIIVLPNSESVPEVIEAIKNELNKLGLDLNDEKTELLLPQEFLEDCAPDEELETAKGLLDDLTPLLWILTTDNRAKLKAYYRNSNEQWWDCISIYQNCLRKLSVFFPNTVMSRRISSFLFNEKTRLDKLKGKSELNLPLIPVEASVILVQEWEAVFRKRNQEWCENLGACRVRLISLLNQSLDALEGEQLSNRLQRKLLRRIRYSANRLSEIGFSSEIVSRLMNVLKQEPALFRNIVEIVEGIARQQFSDEIASLLEYHTNSQSEIAEYMKATILRSVRFLECIDGKLWKMIVANAVGSSVVECLLATETWLFVGHKCRHLIIQEHLHHIEAALAQTASARLRRNYLLILAQYGKPTEKMLDAIDDVFLAEAVEDEMTGEGKLFNYPEPEILKRRYYSGSQQVDGDDSGISSR